MAGNVPDISGNFKGAVNGDLDVGAVNAHLQRRVDGVTPPDKDFTNVEEYKNRFQGALQRGVSDEYVRQKVQNGKNFGTADAMKYIDNAPDDYTKIYSDTGVRRNIVNPTSNPSGERMSPRTMGQLDLLGETATSLERGEREGFSLEGNPEGAKKLVRAANKDGLTAEDVVNYYGLSKGKELSENLSQPMLEAQAVLDKKPAVSPAAAPASSSAPS